MKILLTGFEPFGGEAINPSWEAVKQLAGYKDSVISLMLPCTFAQSLAVLGQTARALEPDIILCVGQAGGRAAISLEKVGINLIEARIPDNQGQQPSGQPVVAGGPTAYFSTLPVKRLRAALETAGIPAEISYSAGTYVCNQVLYGACHLAAALPWGPKAGFVHIPYLPEQAARHPGSPSMALPTLVAALKRLCDELLAGTTEIEAVAGTTH
ncbi:pyroglutamyl-peptidase I [Gallaecimonas kandeliae]|nr:pyroglutamyl-peptidase I [Gallaecimonas kandeliae]WKE64277.1 pyroglutamyl-peptidase I [Gallaecimonas kandeliae]